MTFLVLALENLIFPFVSMAIVLRFLLSPRRGVLSGLRGELPERFGFVSPRWGARPALWVHAASAGEVGAVAGLLREIKRRRPQTAVVLTTTTASGREKARGLPEVDFAALAPLDSFWPVRRFLGALSPRVLLLVETELWPQTIALASSRGLKIGLVNGRVSPGSFRGYRLLAPLLRPFLARIDRAAVQTEADAQRFAALGARRVAVTGNLKFDGLAAAATGEAARALSSLGWGDAPILVAASTHPGEEEAVLDAYVDVRRRFPNCRLVLAPRHVERSGEAAAVLTKKGIAYQAWSNLKGTGEALLLDRFGVLAGFYPLAFACFVGGTLVPKGGHNLLEPAIAGVPVLFGPDVSHTPESAGLLESCGAGRRVADAAELAAALSDLLADPDRARAQGALARRAAEGLRGATERTLAYIEPLLETLKI